MDINKVLGQFARAASTERMATFNVGGLNEAPQVDVAAAPVRESKSIFRDNGPQGRA